VIKKVVEIRPMERESTFILLLKRPTVEKDIIIKDFKKIKIISFKLVL